MCTGGDEQGAAAGTWQRAGEAPAGGLDVPQPPACSSAGAVGWFTRLPSRLLIGLVRLYQIGISPWLGRHCRFHPSCSQYMILAIEKYGPVRGIFRGTLRICRCHPWHPGGYDPP
ncbi:MAG: membrane protein insertion efficiency factor YidD [Planctomycetaceae bacterium]